MSRGPTRRDVLRVSSFSAVAAAFASALPAGAGEKPLAPPGKQPDDLKLPKVEGPPVRYAVVGLGHLALDEVLPAFRQCLKSRVTALVSGHRDKAEAVARAYDVDLKNIYGYDNYDALKDNKDVDAVYVILPNHMHAEYTVRAFKAGKHVLCEKPMAASEAECEQMIEAGRAAGKKLMIAYRLRYEPFNQTMIELSRKQAYGKMRFIEAVNYQNTYAPNIRLANATAGGPLEDVGVYCINAARYITGEEPVEVHGYAQQPADEARFREVPATVVWNMRFPSGVLANCACGFGGEESRRYRVHAEKGWYELENAFAYRGQRLRVKQGPEMAEVNIPPVNHFAAEIDHFSECVRADKRVWTPGEDGLADVRVIRAIKESMKSGRSEKVMTRVAGG